VLCETALHADRPLVSVIIIFLNAERFIAEAVESVLAQTYSAWEILLVDDGSTDRSTAIARGYADSHHANIRYLQHAGNENRGMSASRNLGIEHARGAYLAFLDADDVYLADKLERQVALLQAYPQAAMVYGPSLHWYSWSGRPEDAGRDWERSLGAAPNTLTDPPQLATLCLQGAAHTPATCSVLLRCEAVGRVGGFEPDFRGMYEDQVFFYKILLHEPVYVESNCSDRYRQHPASHLRTARRASLTDSRGNPIDAYRAFLAWLEGYMRATGIEDESLWDAYRQASGQHRTPVVRELLPRYLLLRGTMDRQRRRLNRMRRRLSIGVGSQ
jgi:glycosyltransferase involved in cell wall biosynthesis